MNSIALQKIIGDVRKFAGSFGKQPNQPQQIISPLPAERTITEGFAYHQKADRMREQIARSQSMGPQRASPTATPTMAPVRTVTPTITPHQKMQPLVVPSERDKALNALKTIRQVNPQYKGSDQDILNLYKKHGERLLKGLTQTTRPAPAPAAAQRGSEAIMKYVPIIAKQARANGLSPEELAGALARESMHFNEKYVYGYHQDGTGRGIAGIDKKWNPQVSDEQAFDPAFSIGWMAKQLASLKKAEGGDFYRALRRYNGGPNYTRQTIGFDGQSTIDQLTKRHADAVFEHARNYGTYFK